jgi:Uma2 family endonuclease
MPVALKHTPIEPPEEPPRRKFTRDERERLDATGLFNLNCFELIDGAFYDRNARKKLWTRSECELMERAGIDTEHLELIGGELIDTMGKNSPHCTVVLLIHQWLCLTFGFLRVQQERPIEVADGDRPLYLPQPDLLVLRKSGTRFRNSLPKAADIQLVVEASDTSLRWDLRTKGPLYARAGMPEYWVLDISSRRLIVHRDPSGGKYRSVKTYREHQNVAPLAAPESPFPVAAAFVED